MDDVMIALHNEANTADVASKMATSLLKLDVKSIKIYLSGELGAGKTTFSQYFLKALGVTEVIKSPTYTIIESYHVNDMEVDHIDLYRIQEHELFDLGFLEDEHKAWLIEWPEKGGESLPEPDLWITLTREEILTMQLSPKSNIGQQLLIDLNLS